MIHLIRLHIIPVLTTGLLFVLASVTPIYYNIHVLISRIVCAKVNTNDT